MSDPLGPAENTSSGILSKGYEFWFKCQSKERYGFFFFTDEIQTWEHRPWDWPSKAKYTVQIRTDNNPVIDSATVSYYDDKNRLYYGISGPGTLDLVRAIAAAQTRVIVGTPPNVSGSRDHVATISVEGAREAIGKSLKACNIDVPPSS
jgi:hypothetical protein